MDSGRHPRQNLEAERGGRFAAFPASRTLQPRSRAPGAPPVETQNLASPQNLVHASELLRCASLLAGHLAHVGVGLTLLLCWLSACAAPSPSAPPPTATSAAAPPATSAPSAAPTAGATPQPTNNFDGGPPGGPPQPQQTIAVRNLEGTLIVQGLNRTYRLHLPPVAGQAQSLPLVIALHAQGDNSSDLASVSQLDAVADKAGFLAAYPDGTGAAPGWNAGGCCGYASDHNVDDVAFVRQLIDALQGKYRADPARVFVIGYAEGGMLAQRLAVDLPGRLSALAVVAARLPDGLLVPARPLPVVILLGTSDPQLPSAVAAASLAFWTKSDGCTSEPQRQVSGALSQETYHACAAGLSVVRYAVNGGGHEWPRTTPPAAELIWSFFAAVSRPP